MSSSHSLVDEFTPLLNRVDNGHGQLPAIAPVLERVSISSDQEIPTHDILPYPLVDQATEMAFILAVLLQHRLIEKQSFHTITAYERWFRTSLNQNGVEALEKQIIRVWTQFLDHYRDIREVETVLWTQFQLEIGGLKTVRVADFLGSFPALASHPIIMLSLSHTWRYGVPTSLHSTSPPVTNNLFLSWIKRYDALCTPRVCHCIELICHMAFLVLFAYYLLAPPNRPHTWDSRFDSLGWREMFLMFTPLSLVHIPYAIPNAIPLFVPLAFLMNVPSVPVPGSISFTILLWIFGLHILRLHLPRSPSPLFLFSHHHTLPLANFLTQGLSRMIYPSVLFFLPALLVASFLLSLSVANISLDVLVHLLHLPSPAPMETRVAFLYLFAIILILLTSSCFLLATTLFSSSQKNTDPWDRFSPEVGHMARMALVNTITPYAGLYKFPPPFNILHLLFIRIPRSGANLLGIGAMWGAEAERVLWRVMVGPSVVVFTILYWIRYGRVSR